MLHLASRTDPDWGRRAVAAIDEILLDHAHLEKKAAGTAQTVRELVESYLTRKVTGKRSYDEIARRLRKNVSNVIGDVKLSALHRRDLTRAIDAIKDRGADTEANRVFEDMRAMIRWARGRGDIDENLVEGMSKPSPTVERDRALDPGEIKTVWHRLADADMREATRRVLRLCLVTGQRVGEVCGMTKTELDLDGRIWIIPRERAKNKQRHEVPLSDMAVELIQAQIADNADLASRKKREDPEFVFPGPGARAAMTGAAVAKAVKREETNESGQVTILGVAPWTPHDLRRTAVSQMAALRISPFIIGHVVNHISVTKASVTTKVYDTYDYATEKREALKDWADRLSLIVHSTDNVVPLGRTKSVQ